MFQGSYHTLIIWAILGFYRLPPWLSGKESLAVQETLEMRVWSLGQEDPLEEEMAIHPSILAWRTPWTEETGGLQSKGSQKVRLKWLSTQTTYKGAKKQYRKERASHHGRQSSTVTLVYWNLSIERFALPSTPSSDSPLNCNPPHKDPGIHSLSKLQIFEATLDRNTSIGSVGWYGFTLVPPPWQASVPHKWTGR